METEAPPLITCYLEMAILLYDAAVLGRALTETLPENMMNNDKIMDDHFNAFPD